MHFRITSLFANINLTISGIDSTMTSSLPPFPLILAIIFFLVLGVSSQVPASKTFTFVNHGELARSVAEYGANYRDVSVGNSFSVFPFSLCFYNTTPGAYVLAIRAGVRRHEGISRFVWDANRHRPVGDRATLSLRRDGNLVLSEANGLIAWQTNTANKGVTGIELLRNGNLVLHDRRGRTIWQSFDRPVDTLLIGMSLNINGTRRLISRKSDTDGSDGPYSLVFEEPGLIMYLNYSGQLIRYADFTGYTGNKVTFAARPENANSTAHELILEYTPPPPLVVLQRLSYNSTYSFLRLGSDGNLRIFTYNDNVRYPGWEDSFAYFPDRHVRECALPSKCGQFGLCDNGTCVACPSPKGLLGWSESCAPPRLGRCGRAGRRVDYYRIDGAEHFLTLLVSGEQITVEECRERCSEDCGCRGFVYQENISICLRVPVLATLIREANTSSVYVKYLK